MHILIAGCGKLAQAIFAACQEFQVSCAYFDPKAHRVAASVAVHAGSGKKLSELLDYCEPNFIPIIQASTGQTLPSEVKIPVVDAPNLALPIVYLMALAPDMHSRLCSLGAFNAHVKESHQEIKKSVPGTAVAFAKAVGLQPGDITSVRNPDAQRELEVPEEHLGRHGYHWIMWDFPDMQVELRTRVNGLRPYAVGAIKLAGNLLAKLPDLEAKIHPVSRIM